ncbi:MAG: amidase, partial [Actinomycetota bacterium]
MTDPADLTIDDASEAIRTRVLSPVELTEACLARAERWEPILRAFVRLDPEQAVEQARALTEELARGDVRGPLHGIPVGIKDIIDVKGWPTTASSRVLTELPARRDAAVVDRLRAGGAVFGGKTNTHEFGYGVVTPPTRNPWDPACIPGGSSGGSAAAVAVGGCLGALGTDTAGSVRIPAALCGVSGLKPSRGAGPMSGIIPLAPSMDVCGPIARAARDVALLWQVMAGVPAPGPRGLDRVAVGVADPLSELAEVQPEVASALEAAVETLTEAGARRVPVDLPSVKEWNRPRMTVLMAEALEVHRGRGWYPARANAYTEETCSYLERAERTSPEEVTEACHALALLSRRLVAALDSVDV